MNGDTRIVRGSRDAGDSERDYEGNETRNVGGMGQRSYGRERKTGKVKSNLRDTIPCNTHSTCAFVPRRLCRKRRGHMAQAIAMASQYQSGGKGRLGGQLQFEEL